VTFEVPDQLHIRYSTFVRKCRKKWKYNVKDRQLVIDFKQACDSVWEEVLYKILTEFGIPMKLVGIKGGL